MKLGSFFGNAGRAPLARPPQKKKNATVKSNVAKAIEKKPKPGEFNIDWGKPAPQQVKNYRAVLQLKDLEEYLKKCVETGYASFDWETSPSDETRAYYEPKLEQLEDDLRFTKEALELLKEDNAEKSEVKEQESYVKSLEKRYKETKDEFLRTPLDPWKGEICTVSFSAEPHEAVVVPISHKVGKNIAPELSRNKARTAVLDLMDKYLFTCDKTLKIAVNLAFETKYAAKYERYILGPVADPLMMWVRCMQLAAPHRLKNVHRPATGWGLKPATKRIFGVEMNDFSLLLEDLGVNFFDEIDASSKEGLVYSAEDSDYGLQHYLYWKPIAEQISGYDKWLHHVEMPFMRAIGIMEYWGMRWDTELASQKHKEALEGQENAANEIRKIIKESTGKDVNTGKTGKTNDVKNVLFEEMKLPKILTDKGGISLDKEAIIDIKFMLENKLEDIKEEKYLNVELPEDWESINLENAVETSKLSTDQIRSIRIKTRESHPYQKEGIALLEQMSIIGTYSTLISSHIVGRQKYVNDVSKRIHAGYSTFTDTGRCNSFRPNSQNVPGRFNDRIGIRRFHVPAPGKIMFFIDFSGFELRIMAWKANDETMIELFKTDGDMHRKTASTLTGKPEEEITSEERNDSKPANFGISYGGTEHSLQKTFKVNYGQRKTLDECLEMVNAVKTAYPGIPQYQRNIVIDTREKGYVSTIYGYKRLLPNINSTNRYMRQADERRAGNTPIQGSAADVMKRCQNEVYEKIGWDTFHARQIEKLPEVDAITEKPVMRHGTVDMIAQIHDEIIFEMDDDMAVVTKARDFIKSVMEMAPIKSFPVPVVAEESVGYSWGEDMSIDEWLEMRVKDEN